MAEAANAMSQETLARLLGQEVGGYSLELATPAQLSELAETVATEDLLHYGTATRAAAQLLPMELDAQAFVREHLEHLLWVEQRKALWRGGHIRSPQSVGCRLNVEVREHLEATVGVPTVLIT